ncbi:palmitoyltransferase ZDHHC17-like [Anneissia japonica]|uniref:palmitoyltransferase ZDHHC17-like n=1 Tax=Anneissia japonica TaxID=1529436 RepID=UPI001425852C|nr:palmitoyltransferase ZDHHC17-like [Anneissia japonica]
MVVADVRTFMIMALGMKYILEGATMGFDSLVGIIHPSRTKMAAAATRDAGCNDAIILFDKSDDNLKAYPTQEDANRHTNTIYSNPSMLAPKAPDKKEELPDFSEYDIVKATQYGAYDRVNKLINEGTDVNVLDNEGCSLLHWAAINNRLDLMRLLLSRGALIDRPGGELNASPLHWATRQGHLPAVVLLTQHGADPSIRDTEGLSCIHVASQFGHTSIVAYLVSKGQDPNMIDSSGMTPLMWASFRVFAVDPVRILLTLGASVNLQDKRFQHTALHWAAAVGNGAAVGALLRANADTYIENVKGETCLKIAIAKKRGYIVNQIQDSRGEIPFASRYSFLQSVQANKDVRRKVMMGTPFVIMFLIGFIPELSLHWFVKIILAAVAYGVCYFVSGLFFDPRLMTILPLYIYLATKLYMYSSWFIFFWPYVSDWHIQVPFVFNSIFLWYNFWKAWRSDPGVIKVSQEHRKAVIIELAEAGTLNIEHFCTSCLIKRPIRSKHCSHCDHCVAKFDHHCPWIDNCVGSRNHHYFVLYLLFLEGMISWCLYGTIQFWNNECHTNFENDGLWIFIGQLMSCSPWVFWISLNTFAHILWVGLLLVCQLFQIVYLALTTNERMNQRRYKHLKDKDGKAFSPFNRGMVRNLVDFFNIRCFGLCRPMKIDWMQQFTADLNQSNSSFTRDSYQFV